MAASELLAGHVEAAVGLRAGGERDRVVVRADVVHRQVAAELDAAVPAHGRVGRDLRVELRDALDLLVVGRDAEAHEAVGRGETVEQVDLRHDARDLHRSVGDVEAARARPDDGDAEGVFDGA
jgi:hypothetical protein